MSGCLAVVRTARLGVRQRQKLNDAGVHNDCGGQTFKVFIGDCRGDVAYQCQGCGKGRWSPTGQREAPKPNGNAAVESDGRISTDMVSAPQGKFDRLAYQRDYMRDYMRKRRAKAKQP